jgi:hypothetical protein
MENPTMADLVKALKILGISEISKVMTPVEIANILKMPAKKAAPMVEDALKKAKKIKKDEEVMKALKECGFP